MDHLRREFVGIMFALAVGEVGLRLAALVQAGHPVKYLAAYSHLSLALFVIAASWVGWSRSKVPAADTDVEDLFEWPFVVLLLDTAMVVTYFILVRTVDFSDDKTRIDSAQDVAFWHVVVFGLYLVWDLVTKVIMYRRPSGRSWLGRNWFRGWSNDSDARLRLIRIAPTFICFLASWWLCAAFWGVTKEHLLTADLALLSLVLLFRALKGWVSANWPTEGERTKLKGKTPRTIAFRTAWVVVLTLGLFYGTWMTAYRSPLPLPQWVIDEMSTPTLANHIVPTAPATASASTSSSELPTPAPPPVRFTGAPPTPERSSSPSDGNASPRKQ